MSTVDDSADRRTGIGERGATNQRSVRVCRVHLGRTRRSGRIGGGGRALVRPDHTPSAANLFVKGRAVVTSVDTRSRVGLALLDLTPADGRADGALQIGPVLRGTALRDALEFVKFGDFVNQIAFAEVATALNERARHAALRR